jgi:hypothetical protein
MTDGKLSCKIREMPSTHRIVMVTLLLIEIKNRNIAQKRLDEQRSTNREVLYEVVRRLLQTLTFKHNPSSKRGYWDDLCAEGNLRRCQPVFTAWLADCP